MRFIRCVDQFNLRLKNLVFPLDEYLSSSVANGQCLLASLRPGETVGLHNFILIARHFREMLPIRQGEFLPFSNALLRRPINEKGGAVRLVLIGYLLALRRDQKLEPQQGSIRVRCMRENGCRIAKPGRNRLDELQL